MRLAMLCMCPSGRGWIAVRPFAAPLFAPSLRRKSAEPDFHPLVPRMTSIINRPDPAVLERLEQMTAPGPHDGPMVQALRREAADLAQQMREQDAGTCEVWLLATNCSARGTPTPTEVQRRPHLISASVDGREACGRPGLPSKGVVRIHSRLQRSGRCEATVG